jgi:hypothetical protein
VQLGKFDAAVTDYSRAIELEPMNGRWYVGRGYAQLTKEKHLAPSVLNPQRRGRDVTVRAAGPYGHVASVQRVNGDGTIDVSE